jgi:hypothetical protein
MPIHDPFAEHRDRHMAAALVAAGLSFLVHLATLYLVADWRLDTYMVPEAREEVEPARPPTRIERLPRDPERALGNPERGDPEAGADSGLPAERVRDLARLPDPALITPPSLSRETLAGTLVSLQAPARQPLAFAWQPRQQIVAVLDRRVQDELATLPRRNIPRIERVPKAPDYLPAVDVTRDRFGNAQALAPDTGLTTEQGSVASRRVSDEGVDLVLPDAADPAVAASRFGESPGQITDFAAVDNRLTLGVESFTDSARQRSYFRVRIGRRAGATLPVVPKDIVFVQDSSRSLAEERLYFCRQALQEGLKMLRPGDRFNVVSFSDSARFCFENWSAVEPAALARAAAFIGAMRSEGETDVFASMSALRDLPRDPARPMIAIVVTDGRATAGITGSTGIIGEFTKLNPAGFSVYTLGTHGGANGYLLDMLSYCNRGSSSVVTSGRWDIPAGIQAIIAGVAEPVLGNVAVDVDLASQADIHPIPPANLYAGRALELHGSCPAGVTNLVLQVRGEGGAAKCDVIFRLDLPRAARGDATLREQWARRRMHSLIGAYARQPGAAQFEAMERHSRAYRLPIPYRKEIGAAPP